MKGPRHSSHFLAADPDFGNGPEGVAQSAVVQLVLTQRGKRANIQNEIVDEEHDAAAARSLVGDAVDPEPSSRKGPGCYRRNMVRLEGRTR